MNLPTKERILYAALDLIAEKGYDGVGRIRFTMHDDIVQKTDEFLLWSSFAVNEWRS